MGLYDTVACSTVADADYSGLRRKSKRRRKEDSGLRSSSEIDPLKRMEQLVVLATTPQELDTSRLQNPSSRYSRVSVLPPEIWSEIAKFAKKDPQFGSLSAVLGIRRLTDKKVSIRGRIMAMELLNALFRRSGVARREIVDRISIFIDSSMYSSGSQGTHNEMQSTILGHLQEWDASHGQIFKPLHAAVRYLREGKGFTFPELEAVRNQRNAEREARRSERRFRLLQAKYNQLKREMPDAVPNLKDVLKQAQSCVDLVTGNIFEDFVHEEERTDDDFEWEEGDNHKNRLETSCDDGREALLETVADAGLGSTNYRIEVEVPTEEEQNVSGDMEVVWEQLEGCMSLLRVRYNPLLIDWLATLGQIAGSSSDFGDPIKNEQIVKELTDIRIEVDTLLNRAAVLKQQRPD